MLFQLLFIKKKRINTQHNISIFPWNHTCNIFLFKDPASLYIQGLGTKKGYKLQNHFYEGKETPKQNVSKMAFLEVLNQRTINNFLLCILVFFEFGKATTIIPCPQKTFFICRSFFSHKAFTTIGTIPAIQDFKICGLCSNRKAQRSLTKCIISHAEPKKVEFKRIIGAFLV